MARGEPMTRTPKFSVIIPVYNRPQWIGAAIDSVLAQTFQDFEIIVCDDGSTDTTPAVLTSYGELIHVVHTNRLGPGAARNAGAAAATGQYLACLDSDDRWAPWTLKCVDAVLRETGAGTSVYLKPVYVDSDSSTTDFAFDGEIRFGVYDSFLDAPTKMPCGAGLLGAIPRETFLAIGGFEHTAINAEDRDLALKLSQHTKYAVVDSPHCIYYRRHESQQTAQWIASLSGWRLIAEHYRQGHYGPTTDCKLAGYMAMFFAGQVGTLLNKGQAGRDAQFFWQSFKFASGNFRRETSPNMKQQETWRIASSAIRRITYLYPFLFVIAVAHHITARSLCRATGWTKRPEHKFYVAEINRMQTMKIQQ